MISVEYRVFLVEDRALVELDEATLGAWPPAFRDRLNVSEVLAGSVRIQADGQPMVEVLDELWHLVQVLCFEGACALAGEDRQPFRYRYMSAGCELTLTPAGRQVRVTGRDVPTVVLERAELAAALYDCGARFLRLLAALGAPRAELLRYLTSFAERARVCLGR